MTNRSLRWSTGIWCILAARLSSPCLAGVTVAVMNGDPSTGGSQRTVLVTLSGRIDAQTVADFETGLRPHLHPVYTNYETRGNIVLRLQNSDGGVVREGLKIAAKVREEHITTFVPKDSKCKSACALIFLAGSRSSYGMGEWPERILEIGGVVGFHGPYDPEGSSGANVMAAGVSIARQIQATLGDALPQDLFVETITLPAGITKDVDSVYDALRWNIQLSGYRTPDPGREGLLNACINFFNWKHKQPIGAIEGIDMYKQEPQFLEDKDQNSILDRGQNAIKSNNYVLPGEDDGIVLASRETHRAPDFLKDIRLNDGTYASQFAFSHEDEAMAFWCSAIHQAHSDRVLIFPRRISVGRFLNEYRGVVQGQVYDVPEWFEFPAGAMLSSIKK
jgi:hypothetical protein